jgi:response regulator NasT
VYDTVTNIIVLFPKIEDAKNIKNLLMRNGIQVTVVCNSGAQALSYADELHGGIVVCGYRFTDMLYTDLLIDMPRDFEMLLVTSKVHIQEARQMGVMCVSMPVKLQDLINTIMMMSDGIERKRRKRKQKPASRSEEDKVSIQQAKKILMDRNNMSEEEAHRYIQKTSMDSGRNMVETARMVISLYH